jgi:hypothetical protein
VILNEAGLVGWAERTLMALVDELLAECWRESVPRPIWGTACCYDVEQPELTGLYVWSHTPLYAV